MHEQVRRAAGQQPRVVRIAARSAAADRPQPAAGKHAFKPTWVGSGGRAAAAQEASRQALFHTALGTSAYVHASLTCMRIHLRDTEIDEQQR